MSDIAVRTLPDRTRAKSGPTTPELQKAAVDQIDAAIKELRDMRDHLRDVAPGAPGVAWQAHTCGQNAIGCTSQALAAARELAHLTRPVDE